MNVDHLETWIIFAVASAAVIGGDNAGLRIGDKGGYRLAKRYVSKVHLDERKLKVGRDVFDRHGAKVVFFGHFVSILRTYAAFLAGTSKMGCRRFLPANAVGGIVRAEIYTFACYEAGTTLRHLSGKIDLALGVAAVVVIIVALLIAVRHSTSRLADKSELAYSALSNEAAGETEPHDSHSGDSGSHLASAGRGTVGPERFRRNAKTSLIAQGPTTRSEMTSAWSGRPF